MGVKPTVICMTPVRNEAWILDRFLTAASMWANHIIIADQRSTDGSREIAASYNKVILIDNDSGSYHEADRHKLLIAEARKIGGSRLLVSLDADEIFTPNILTSSEWEAVLQSAPGSVIQFQWANLFPGYKRMWFGGSFPWGYMDDGYPYEGILMHSPRIPLPPDSPILTMQEIKVLHFQYAEWSRMQSKHRWYQCFERINYPGRSPLEIFRQYHHMHGIPAEDIRPVPDSWIQDYQQVGLDLTVSNHQSYHWWDEQIVAMMEQYGSGFFRKVSIWDVNWADRATSLHKTRPERFTDPRSLADKFIQLWLRHSQKLYKKWPFRYVDRFFQVYGGY